MVKYSHRKKFNPADAKEILGVATEKLEKYKEMASFLGSKKMSNENIVDYFKRIFPSANAEKVISRNASKALTIIETQPGSEFAEGTYWSAFNTVTYMTDHTMGRNPDTRLTSSWFGVNKGLKTKALEVAIEMANAA